MREHKAAFLPLVFAFTAVLPSSQALLAQPVSGARFVSNFFPDLTTFQKGNPSVPNPPKVPDDLRSQPAPTVKVVYTGPGHTFDVKVDVGLSPTLPSGRIDAASRLLQLDQDFRTTLNVSINWTRANSASLPPPYRAELTVDQTTQGPDDSTRVDCADKAQPAGLAPGVSTITKSLSCAWGKLPLFLQGDTLPAETQNAIGLPPDRPLVVLQSVADFQVFASNGSHADGFTIMVFTYYSADAATTPVTAKIDPSVVFPRDSGTAWPLTLATASAPDITAVKFGTLPSAAIGGRDAQSLSLTQIVPPDTAPGRYQLTVTQKGQPVSLPVYLYVAGIEILDPNPGLLTAAGAVDFSAASLAGAAGGLARRKAVSADGVTQVFLRIPSDQPLSVEVLGEKVGSVQPVDDSPSRSAYGTPVADPQVGSAVFVLYTPPKDLARKTMPGEYDFTAADDLDAPAPNDPGTQSVPIRITVIAPGGVSSVNNNDAIRKQRAITLVRPPMVLIHGIWSSRDVWSTATKDSPAFEAAVQRLTGARWVGTADYKDYNARSFDPRRPNIEGIDALKSEIQLTLGHYRDAGIAATQVDVVGHSMGGIMTRVFSQRKTEYLRKNNFMQGDVHKLVTLDTPHTGSLFVLYLWKNRALTLASKGAEDVDLGDGTIQRYASQDVQRLTVGDVFMRAGMPIDKGAVENFRPCSEAIRAIDGAPIPTHALSGIRPDSVNTNFLAKTVFTVAAEGDRVIRSVDEVIGHKEHDVIVEAESMRGGLPYAAVGENPLSKPSHDQPDVTHSFVVNRIAPLSVSVVGNPATQAVVADILQSPVDEGSVYSTLPAPRDVRAAPWHTTSLTGDCVTADSEYARNFRSEPPRASAQSAALLAAASDPYLEIVSPSFGAEFAPGDTVTISAVGRNGLQPKNVFFFGAPNNPLQTADGSLQATLTIPADFAGRNRIEVYAGDGSGNGYRGVTEILVRPARPFTGLLVSPAAIRFTYATQTAQLSVKGRYADGTTVSLSGYPDLQCSASNSGVVSVSGGGKVQAVRAGSDFIQVALGGLTARVPVNVSISNTPPVFDPMSAIQVAAGETRSVTLRAASPMGNQVALRAVALPAFATFTASGNTGVLRLSPQSGNLGDYRIEFAAGDNGDPPLSTGLIVNVTVTGAAAAGPPPVISAGGIGNTADLQPVLAPGGLATIFGTSLADGVVQATQVPWPRQLGAAQVTVNGQPVPLYFVSPQQVNFQVPFEVPLQGTIDVGVIRGGVAGATARATVAEYAPAVFQSATDPIVVHTDFQLVNASRPARPAEVLIVYATGVGGVSNQPATGAATPASPLPSALITPAVTIGGAAADVLFAGLAPYLVGVAQFNIRLPATLPAGSRLPLVIRFGNAASQPVNLAVQPSPTPPVNVLISDSFNRANADKCALGKADLALGGTGSHYYVPVFPTGAVIVSGALQNNSQAYGGVQLTNSSTPCSAWGETVGQDLNIKLDLLLPTDAAGHISQGGPYLRARSAFTADGILGGDSAGYWIQLQSTGEVKIKNLNSASVIATSARPASFDSKVFHTLEVSVKENSLQASVDGVLATFGQSTTVSIPPTAGSNNGAAGIAFAAEPNQGAIGGQRARNLAVTAYRALP